MTPTDADRQRAREIVGPCVCEAWPDPERQGSAPQCGWHNYGDRIAAAIAAARAEGWREGQTDSLTAVANLSSILPAATSLIRAAILNLKEPGHGK